MVTDIERLLLIIWIIIPGGIHPELMYVQMNESTRTVDSCNIQVKSLHNHVLQMVMEYERLLILIWWWWKTKSNFNAQCAANKITTINCWSVLIHKSNKVGSRYVTCSLNDLILILNESKWRLVQLVFYHCWSASDCCYCLLWCLCSISCSTATVVANNSFR